MKETLPVRGGVVTDGVPSAPDGRRRTSQVGSSGTTSAAESLRSQAMTLLLLVPDSRLNPKLAFQLVSSSSWNSSAIHAPHVVRSVEEGTPPASSERSSSLEEACAGRSRCALPLPPIADCRRRLGLEPLGLFLEWGVDLLHVRGRGIRETCF